MNWKNFLKGLLHVGSSAAAAVVVQQLATGHALTSGNVVVPAAGAFCAALVHAAFPNAGTVDQTGTDPTAK